MGQQGPQDLVSRLRAEADAAGFAAFGIADPAAIAEDGARFRTFLALGRQGEMAWLAAKADRRADPFTLWPDVRSVIMLGMNYAPARNPMEKLAHRSAGNISCYAQGRDYHIIVKKRLKKVAGWLHRETGAEVKVFVDTAPVLEKPLARAAALGWQGKHTNLVSRQFGSWLFLGAIFTTLPLTPDNPEADHCGSCRACLDICPTGAFPAPRQLDARRCISYLTIEYAGHIAPEFRRAIGNRIYGCDDCLAVCPWNKWARTASEAAFHPRASADNPLLGELLELDDAAFRARFAGSPIKRTGRDRFVRNCLIAAGNSGDRALLGAVVRLLEDRSPLVRAMAVWAVGQLADAAQITKLSARYLAGEADHAVRAEWAGASAPEPDQEI